MSEPSLTIGLLEDDPDQSALFSRWLLDAGFGCKIFVQAAEFRRRLGAEAVDALIDEHPLAGYPRITWITQP